MSPPANTWDEVKAQLQQVVAASVDAFDPATVDNAADLLIAIRSRVPVPEIRKGYWSTIRLTWNKCEIEVFPDHVEIYRFADKQTDIRHYDHHPGEAPSADLLSDIFTLLVALPH